MRLTLTVTAGPHKGRTFTFAEHDTFIVGRSSRAHFRLSSKDSYFSRHHFLVEVNPPYCRLLDLGSRNGTFLNGVRVGSGDLHDGDQIKAGRTILRASIEPDASAAIPETIPPPGVAGVAPVTPVPQQPPGEGVPAATALPATVGYHLPAEAPPPFFATGCPACGAPLTAGIAATLGGALASLCPACEGAVLDHPQPIHGYRIVRELGRGAMGVVDLALSLTHRRLVALKTIIPQGAAKPADVARFLREASILREFDHPHIVAFRDLGESNGRFFFAMDYVSGVNAARLLKEHGGRLPISRAVGLMGQLLAALDYAHAKKYVHRDIKPSNVLVAQGRDPAGATCDVVKLADFGLARVYQASSLSGLTMKGDFGGTFPFMPPEQITNFRESLPTNDLYSVGATLYNLLTGCYVYDFPQEFERRVIMLLQDDPVPIRSRLPDIPPGLAQIIHRALAREPGDRFANARAMGKELAPYQSVGT